MDLPISSIGVADLVSRKAAKPSLTCRNCPVGRFAIYAKTYQTSSDTISEHRSEVVFAAANKSILREGDVPTKLFTLFSGWAFKFRMLGDGRRQILGFLVPGDPIGLAGVSFPGLRLPFSVKSLTEVSLCSFAPPDLAQLTVSSVEQRNHFARVMRDYIAGMQDQITNLGRRSALGRLAHLLLILESKLESRGESKNGTFEFPPKQEHLADALGLTPAHVNRTLDRLRQDKLINFDRATMSLLDKLALQQIAEEE